MSRKFNGTNQSLSVAINLSSFAQLSISFWMWWDAFANNDKLAMEYGFPTENAGLYIDPNASSGHSNFLFGIAVTSAGNKYWVDEFTRPSAAAWHHYVLTMNRATPVHTGYLDGVVRSLVFPTHNAATYGNFSNSTLTFMSRTNTTLWGAGRMAHVALWPGTILTARNALALSSGASPMRIGPIPTYYWPLWGDAADADYGGTRKTVTLTGTPTAVAHPPVVAQAF